MQGQSSARTCRLLETLHNNQTSTSPSPAPWRGWQPVAKPKRKRCWNGTLDPKHLPLRCSSTSGCKILLLQPLKYTRLPCCHGVGLQEYRCIYGNIQTHQGPLFVGTEQIKALRTAALVDSEIQGCCLLWELLVMLLCLNSGLGRVLMGDQWCPVCSVPGQQQESHSWGCGAAGVKSL